jgi:hypothetical protein
MSFVLLFISFLLFVIMWISAYMHNNIPVAPWGEYGGNHGYWRHSYDLRELWWYIFSIFLYSFILAIVAFVIKPNRKAAIIAAIALVSFFLFGNTHYWLVD